MTRQARLTERLLVRLFLRCKSYFSGVTARLYYQKSILCICVNFVILQGLKGRFRYVIWFWYFRFFTEVIEQFSFTSLTVLL